MPTTPRSGTPLAWSLWLVTLGCCAAGLAVTLAAVRPLTLGVLAEGAARALVYPLGYATIGLVLGLRRPANPIGWLFATSGLLWSLTIPFDPWVNQLILDHIRHRARRQPRRRRHRRVRFPLHGPTLPRSGRNDPVPAACHCRAWHRSWAGGGA